VTAYLPQASRSDAQDNRERILTAARTVFATEGLNASVREIAERAAVAPATVYRHFPTKQELAVEALAGQINACHTVLDAALADPDPWHGFVRVVEDICELHARDRGFTAAFTSAFPRAVDFTALRERALASVAEVARRAKASGRLRRDFVVEDLVLVLMANHGIRAVSPNARVAASRRFAALAIQGFRASAETVQLPPVARLAPMP
jgi:AcrR family transcriptional regulator